MTAQQLISKTFATSKRYKVMVGGELERTTDGLGLMLLLHKYSDFGSYTAKEKATYLKESLENGWFYIDDNIVVK